MLSLYLVYYWVLLNCTFIKCIVYFITGCSKFDGIWLQMTTMIGPKSQSPASLISNHLYRSWTWRSNISRPVVCFLSPVLSATRGHRLLPFSSKKPTSPSLYDCFTVTSQLCNPHCHQHWERKPSSCSHIPRGDPACRLWSAWQRTVLRP